MKSRRTRSSLMSLNGDDSIWWSLFPGLALYAAINALVVESDHANCAIILSGMLLYLGEKKRILYTA